MSACGLSCVLMCGLVCACRMAAVARAWLSTDFSDIYTKLEGVHADLASRGDDVADHKAEGMLCELITPCVISCKRACVLLGVGKTMMKTDTHMAVACACGAVAAAMQELEMMRAIQTHMDLMNERVCLRHPQLPPRLVVHSGVCTPSARAYLIECHVSVSAPCHDTHCAPLARCVCDARIH